MKIDFDHVVGTGIADEIQNQIREERVLTLISKLGAEFNIEGKQYYFRYGKGEKDKGTGIIVGFGETPYAAAEDFFDQFCTTRIK